MKKILKRIIKTILIFVVIINVVEGFSGVNKEKLDQSIDKYYESGHDEINIVSYKELGNKRYGMFINEYEVVKLDTYKNEDGRVVLAASITCPVKFKMISLLGTYKMLWRTLPDEGESYGSSLKRMLPKEIVEDLDENYTKYAEEVSSANKEKLKMHLSEN